MSFSSHSALADEQWFRRTSISWCEVFFNTCSQRCLVSAFSDLTVQGIVTERPFGVTPASLNFVKVDICDRHSVYRMPIFWYSVWYDTNTPSNLSNQGWLGPSLLLLVVGPKIPMVGRTRASASSPAGAQGLGFVAIGPVCFFGPLPFLRLSIAFIAMKRYAVKNIYEERVGQILR